MNTLKTNKGYLLKMVFLCDARFPLEMNDLLALTVFKLCLCVITCLCNIIVGLFSTECLQESQKIPELLTLRLVHLQGAVISGGKVFTPRSPLPH